MDTDEMRDGGCLSESRDTELPTQMEGIVLKDSKTDEVIDVDDREIGTAEAARIIDRDVSTIRRWCEEGKIEAQEISDEKNRKIWRIKLKSFLNHPDVRKFYEKITLETGPIIKQLYTEMARLSGVVGVYKGRLEEKEQLLTALKTELGESRSVLTQTKEEAEAARVKIQMVEEERRRIETRVDGLSKDKCRLESQARAVEIALAQTRTELTIVRTEKDRQITELRKEKTDAVTKAEEVLKKSAEIEYQKSVAELKVTQFGSELKSAKTRFRVIMAGVAIAVTVIVSLFFFDVKGVFSLSKSQSQNNDPASATRVEATVSTSPMPSGEVQAKMLEEGAGGGEAARTTGDTGVAKSADHAR